MKMELIMVLRGQYPAGDDMQVRLDDLSKQAKLAEKLGYWGSRCPVISVLHRSNTSTRLPCWPISLPKYAI